MGESGHIDANQSGTAEVQAFVSSKEEAKAFFVAPAA